MPWETLSWHPYAVKWPEDIPPGSPLRGFEEKLFYTQNASSLLPVIALGVKPDNIVLDACAAPGGKALAIAQQLSKNGKLFVNDISQARSARLRAVFKEYMPDFSPTYLTMNAAVIFKKYPDYFDRILIDAPCSSEKHVLNSPKHLAEWSQGRIRRLAYTQLSLINGLFLALRPGGRMVYSTCSITPEENEKIIKKFLKKYEGQAGIIPFPKNLPGAQNNSPFCRIDITNPANTDLDPMFAAIITKY